MEAQNVLTALPREIFALVLRQLDAASIAFLALCSKALWTAIRREKTENILPDAQRKLRISDFVRDPELLAAGLMLLEFPCESLTLWAIRVGSVSSLEYLRRIGFLDAKSVCTAAAKKGDLAVLEWSLTPDIYRYWASSDCKTLAHQKSAMARAWVQKNGCPCFARDCLSFIGSRFTTRSARCMLPTRQPTSESLLEHRHNPRPALDPVG